jgi:hypothetical protein
LETKEKNMRVYTVAELFCMTRAQLFALHDGATADLENMPEGSTDRDNALLTLRRIRRVLAQFRPGT